MKRIIGLLALAGALVTAGWGTAAATAATPTFATSLSSYKHIVVIYQENHSFDNLYGLWGNVGGQAVNGLQNATSAQATQINADGNPYNCLKMVDPNFSSTNPLLNGCTDNTTATSFKSHFANSPFNINDYVAPSALNCASSNTGGCTNDLVHRFYQEQFQINGGKQNRYALGSDAAGATMGYYDTTRLPIYNYLHQVGAPNYVIADNFFQAAFGGSFLNHQWLVAAQNPVFANAVTDGSANDLHAVLDDQGMPRNNYPLYQTSASYVKDKALTAACATNAVSVSAGARATSPKGLLCGDYAVNTIQPFTQPYYPGTPDAQRLPLLTSSNIGDELSAKNIDWAWYSGGWDNANGNVNGTGWTNGTAGTCADPQTIANASYPNCPNALFQFHHQPFNYFKNYATGDARAQHLLDETNFIAAAKAGTLKPVSFVKPMGNDNEHPGYTGENGGSQHLVDLIKAIENGPNGKDTLILVTYDEFGGAWDHVSPPTGAGVSDQSGPGTRIPALLIGNFGTSGVDGNEYDTTSFLATVESMFGVAPLSTRDAAVNNFGKTVAAMVAKYNSEHPAPKPTPKKTTKKKTK
jgi:acid phosphatase